MNVFKEKGEFKVVLGTGHLSLYEINRLKEGDVVTVSHRAGNPYPVYFNDNLLCHGEIVVIDNVCGVRISPRPCRDFDAPFSGVTDDVVELLPTSIVFDTIKLSVKELQGVSEGSIVYLGKKYDEDVELQVAGVPVASGEPVTVNEKFGIRISKVYHPGKEVAEVRFSGYMVDTGSPNTGIKKVNFKRPDKLTSESIATMIVMHESFVMSLKTMDEAMHGWTVTNLDEAAFCEMYGELKNGYSFVVAGMENRAAGPLQQETSVPEKKYFLQEENTRNPADADDVAAIVTWMKSGGQAEARKMLVCFKQDGLFGRLNKDGAAKDILPLLRNCWKNVGDVAFDFERATDRFEDAKILPDNDMIVAIGIGPEEEPEQGCILVYPYISLEPVMGMLT